MSYFPKRNIPTVSEWEAFSPTGAWNTNVSYIGKYRRVGDVAEVWVDVSLSGEPNSATFSLNPPNGLVPDETKLNPTALGMPLGIAIIIDSGTAVKGNATVCYNASSNSFFVRICTISPSSLSDVTQSVPQTFANGDRIFMLFSFPVEGWS